MVFKGTKSSTLKINYRETYVGGTFSIIKITSTETADTEAAKCSAC